jgi:hypothetical protein
MSKTFLMIAALVLGIGVSAAAAATDVTGVLVDKACYLKEKVIEKDPACAQACAKDGGAVALVTEKGEIYDVMVMGGLAGEKNAKLVPHMLHTVTLTGDVVESKDKSKMIHATALKMISK